MFDFFVRRGKRLAAYRRRRDAVRELSALDDRMLKDIGLRRAQTAPVIKDFDPRQF